MAKNRTSWDLKLHNGLILPMEGDVPNGTSLRQLGRKIIGILEGFKLEPRVYRMQEGSPVPVGTVLIHEHSNYWSLQVAEPMSLGDYNGKQTKFLEGLPSQTKTEFLEAWYG
ncbi:UNVERIFIED_CONTAM: hypothetical protein HDU68_011346 [Siphonaria sp. JEL0065]|nr:hypothetical protein HDU68_011346 [Siphonaria sp. JEL0065]